MGRGVPQNGDNTEQRIHEYLQTYSDDTRLTFAISKVVVTQARAMRVDPHLVVGIILRENVKLDPSARGGLGEYGLMQVMPFHQGRFPSCGTNLEDIRTNICYGVRILSEALEACGEDLRCALLRYNGCVTGANAPNCFSYPDVVLDFSSKLQGGL